MKTTFKFEESESEESTKQRRLVEKEARRLSKLFGETWEAKWADFQLGSDPEVYWRWSAERVSERIAPFPPFQISEAAREFMADLIVAVARSWKFDPKDMGDSDSDESELSSAIADNLFDVLGVPEDHNPSGDEGCRWRQKPISGMKHSFIVDRKLLSAVRRLVDNAFHAGMKAVNGKSRFERNAGETKRKARK